MVIAGQNYRFGHRTYVMGILNVTPDSFSGDGLAGDVEAAVRQAARFVEAGVDFLDVGGESTRPGAEPVPVETEIERTIPLIQRLRAEFPQPISIDTYHAATARAALEAGAHLVNDITGLRGDPEMAQVVAEFGVPVVLMHIQGTPRTMQQHPTYEDVVEDIRTALRESIALATAAGIAREQIIIDPGIGFGKTLTHNLQILRRLGEFRTLGCPILVGPSRKSFLGQILDLPVTERLEGTAASVAVAIAHGADMVRVHDVPQMVRVVRVADAIVRGLEGHGGT
jgi:dihydropteroate synthase